MIWNRFYSSGCTLLILVLVCIPCGRLRAQRSPLWGGLEQGPYAVGFKTVEQYDHSRIARCKRGPDGEPRRGERGRPLQVCVWYPALVEDDARTIVYGEYVFPNPADVRFFNLLAMLQAREIYERVLPALNNDQQVMLELMNMKLAAVRNTLHREGSFPLILYIAHASCGIVENVVMCEFLASHGYIVATTHSIGTPFIYPEVNCIDLETLVRDAEFIMASLHEWPHLDRGRLGVIGRGLGGAAALVLQMRNTDVDAVIGLAGVYAEHEHSEILRESLHYDPARMRTPFLHVYRDDPEAVDAGVLNDCRYADRYLLTFTGMNDAYFTSYGAVSAMVADTTAPPPETKHLAYETVCRYALQFMRAHLYGDGDAKAFIERAPEDNGIAANFAALEVKRGETAPTGEDRFIEIVIEEGIEQARSIYEEAVRSGHGPPFQQEAMNRLGVLYARMRRVNEGIEILQLNTQAYPGSASAWLSLAFTCMYTGRAELAAESFHKVLDLLPDDTTLSEEEREGVRGAAERSLERLEGSRQ